MVFCCLPLLGPFVAGFAIGKAIVTSVVEIHLCDKCSKALKRDIEELREQLVSVEREHPAAAAEVRALQGILDRAAENLIAEYQSKRFVRRLCTAAKHLEHLEDADKEICSAINSLLAKLDDVPNEVMSRFFKDSYARRHGRSFWSIFFRAEPSVPQQRGNGILPSPPPSPSAPERTTIRRGRRRLPNDALASSLHKAIFMRTNQTHFWSLLQKETAHKRKKLWACCLF